MSGSMLMGQLGDGDQMDPMLRRMLLARALQGGMPQQAQGASNMSPMGAAMGGLAAGMMNGPMLQKLFGGGQQPVGAPRASLPNPNPNTYGYM